MRVVMGFLSAMGLKRWISFPSRALLFSGLSSALQFGIFSPKKQHETSKTEDMKHSRYSRLARPHHESRCEIYFFFEKKRRTYQNYRCYVRLLLSITPPKKTKIEPSKKEVWLRWFFFFRNPRHSMYGICTYIWWLFTVNAYVNVGKYTTHGWKMNLLWGPGRFSMVMLVSGRFVLLHFLAKPRLVLALACIQASLTGARGWLC